MKKRLAAIAVVAVCLTIVGAPVRANAAVQSDQFGIEIHQHADGGDHISFTNLDLLNSNSDDNGTQTTDPFGFGSDSNGIQSETDSNNLPLFKAFEGDLGLDTSRVHYSSEFDDGDSDTSDFGSTDGIDPFASQVNANTYQNLFAQNGGTFTLNVDASALARTAEQNGISDFTLSVCPLNIPATNTSTRSSDSFDSDSNCTSWDETANTTDTLKFTEHPSSGAYWHTIEWIALGAVLTLIALGVGAFFLRKVWKTVGVGTLVVVASMTFVAWLAVGIAFGLIFGAANSLDEYVLTNDLNGGQHVLAATLPALMWMIPFLVPAIWLLLVPAPYVAKVPKPAYPYAPQQYGAPAPYGPPGVPTWMGGPDATVQGNQWTPDTWSQPSANAWAQQPTPPPAPGWQPQQPPQQTWQPQQPTWQPPPPVAPTPQQPTWQPAPDPAAAPAVPSEAAPAPEPAAPEPPAPEPSADQQPQPPSPEPPQTWHPPA